MKRMARKMLLWLSVALTLIFSTVAFIGCKNDLGDLLPSDGPTTEQPEEQPHEHVYADKFEQDEDGHWKVCTDENCPDKDKEPEKTAHTYGEGVKKSDSSCTVRGETDFTCTDCGYVKTEYAPFVHNYEDYSTIAPTCTTKGYTIQRCTVCKDEVRTNPTNELGHDYEESVQTKTCTSPEITTYTCKNGCNDSYHEITAPATGHNTDNATWTVASETLVEDSQCLYVVTEETCCQNANCSETVTRRVDGFIHKGVYTSQITKEANCTVMGEITYTCVCGESEYTYTSEYAGSAHSWDNGEQTGGMVVYTCRHNAEHTKQEVSATKDVATSSATISADALTNLNTDTAAEVEVTQNTKMQMDSSVLSAIAGASATDVTLVAEELDASQLPNTVSTARVGDTVYNFDLKDANGVSLFDKNNTTGGKITITVPYTLQPGEDPATITILWLNEDGTTEAIDAKYDSETETVSFELEHFSYYTVVRMTAEELCTRDGHNNSVTVVPNTCTQAGYTLTICTRCNLTTRTDHTPATGHNHVTTVVEATCTERGFTRYVCQNAGCNDSYVMNYTAQRPHAYQDKVIAPTCTEKGHTAHVCRDCGKTYRDTYVVPNGHTYRNGNCKDCGEKDLTHLVNADNFYFNLINSVVNADGFYIEVEDVVMSGETSYTGLSGEVSYEMEMYRFMFKVDDDGYIVGQGEGKMKAEMTATQTGEQPETEKIEMDMIVVFQDGKMYSFQKQTERVGDFTSVADWYMLDTQENMDLDSLREMYETLDGDSVLAIIGGIMGKENNPINTAMANVVNYLFDKTETTDGFAYVLNYAKIPEIYTAMTEDSVAVAFDKIFGDGAFTSVSTYALALPAKTVAEFKTDVVKWCLDCGVEITDVYAVIDSFMNAMADGGEEFSTSELIGGYENSTVAEVLNECMGEEMLVEDYQGMIQSTLDMLSQSTVADFIVMAGSSMGGGNGVQGGVQPNPQPMSGDGDNGDGNDGDNAMQEQIAQYIAFFGEQLNALINSLSAEGKSAMGFTTDKSGDLMTVSMLFNEFTHSLTVDSSMFVTDEDDAVGIVSVEMSFNGNATLIVNGSYVADYDEIITALERSVSLFHIQNQIELVEINEYYDGDFNVYYERNEYLAVPTSQGTLIMPSDNEYYGYEQNYNYSDNYNGTPCYSYETRVYGEWYLLKPESGLQFKNSCNGWKEYRVSAECGEGAYYKIYYLQDGTRLAVVPMVEETLAYMHKGDSRSCTLYYNASENEFSMTAPHSYVLVAQDIPTECEEEGYRQYRCTVCAHQVRDSLYKWHEHTEWRYELADGAQSCEDGVKEIYYCNDCEQVVHSNKVSEERAQEHPTWTTETALIGAESNTCDEHVMHKYACACGEVEEYYVETYYEGNDTFDRIYSYHVDDGKENHYCEVYRCAVTSCAYTYVKEYYYVSNAQDCTRTWYCTTYFNVKNLPEEPTGAPTDYTEKHTYAEKESWHDTTETVSWNGNIKTVQRSCNNCNNPTQVTKYECFNVSMEEDPKGGYNYSYDASREVYYFYYTSGYGYRYVYDENCNRTTYPLSWNEDKTEIVEGDGYQGGVEHRNYEQTLSYATCTQFGERKQSCYACDYEFTYQYAGGGHNHEYYDGYCRECGMYNETGANGAFVMEDMTQNGVIRVGYFNRFNRNYEILVFFNYGEENQIRVDMDEWSSLICHEQTFRTREEAMADHYYHYYPWGLECGVIALNMDVLQSLMDAQNVTLDALTIVISSSYNYEAEDGYEERALEYGVTFEIGKSGLYQLNRLVVDGEEVGLQDGLTQDTVTLALNENFTYTLTIDGSVYEQEEDVVYTGDWQAHGNLIRLFIDEYSNYEEQKFFVICCDGETVKFETSLDCYSNGYDWLSIAERDWTAYDHYVLSK